MSTKDKLTLPSLTDDPEFAAAKAKYTELQTALLTANSRYDAILGELNAAGPSTSLKVSARTAAALKLIGRGSANTPGASASQLREELSKVGEDRRVLEEAVGMQKEFVGELRSKVSRRIIADLTPAYRELVRDIAKAVMALDSVLAVEHNFRDELFQRDIMLGELRPMPLHGFGRSRDENSRCSVWLMDAVEFQFLQINEIPETLRPCARAKMAKPVKVVPILSKPNADGWVNAAA